MKKIVRLTESDLTKLVQKVIEEQNFFNTVGTKIKGAAAGVKSTLKNMTGQSGKERISSKLANIFAQTKSRSNYIETQIKYFGTEILKLESELNIYKQNNPSYATEVDNLLNLIKGYQNVLQQVYNYSGKFRTEADKLTMGGGQSTSSIGSAALGSVNEG